MGGIAVDVWDFDWLWTFAWLHTKFIQNKTRQNLALFSFFFCFQLRPSNPLGLHGNWTCWLQKLLSSFDIPNINSAKKVHKSQNWNFHSTQHKVKTIFSTWNHKQNKYKFSFTLKFAKTKANFLTPPITDKKSCIRFLSRISGDICFQTYSKPKINQIVTAEVQSQLKDHHIYRKFNCVCPSMKSFLSFVPSDPSS